MDYYNGEKVMVTLRDYQIQAVDSVNRELETHRSTCLVQATGLGKSLMAAELVRKWHPSQTMFVCEKTDLVRQAAIKIQEHTGIECAIEQGFNRIDFEQLWSEQRPIVASIQSLNSRWGDNAKRMHKFRPRYVILDECHHCASEQFEKLFRYLDTLDHGVKLVGLSATPFRLDGKGLEKYFETIAHQTSIRQGIDGGWLCDIAQEYIRVQGLDYSKVHTARGDLDAHELAQLLEPEQMVQRMVHPSLEIIFGVDRGSLAKIPPDQWQQFLIEHGHKPFRTIMFCVSIAQAQLAAEVFRRVVPDLAQAIWGNDPERGDKLEDFRYGKFPVMCNCSLLGEGVDVPEVEVILQGRPTKSLALWIQQLGRGTRTLPGLVDGIADAVARRQAIAKSAKPWVRVVDYVGNSGRHKLISSIEALAGHLSDEVKQKALQRALAKGKPVAIAETLSIAERELEREKAEARIQAEQQRKRHLVASAQYQSKSVDAFDGKQSILSGTIHFKKPKGPPPTPKQAKLVGKFGINPTKISKKDAGFIIGKLIENKWQCPQWLKDKCAA